MNVLASSILPLLTALAGVLIGGFLTHLLSTRRDIAVKRREIILNNLIQATEEIDKSIADRPGAELKQLENVIALVQMFGEKEMVDLANRIIIDMAEKEKADLTPLLMALRDRIRQELKLKRLPYGYMSLVIRYPGDKGFEEMKAKRQSQGTPKWG